MILILTEKLEIANPVKEGLEKAGYEACSVTKFNIDTTPNMLPDLIVLDWVFPNSKDIVKIFKANDRGTHIITLTQKHAVEEVIDSFDSGVDDFVEKPFPISILIQRAQALLKGPRRDLP